MHIAPLDTKEEIEHKVEDSEIQFLATLNEEPLITRSIALIDGGMIEHLIVADDLFWTNEALVKSGGDLSESLSVGSSDQQFGWPDFAVV